MHRGRPPIGAKLVENIEGSRHAKDRSRVILETLTGDRTVEDARRELGLGKTAFHKLRRRALKALVAELEPKPVGRPRSETAEDAELANLREEVATLRCMARAAQIREQIALTMPHLLKDGDEQPEAESNKKKRKRVLTRRERKQRRKQSGKRSRSSGGSENT